MLERVLEPEEEVLVLLPISSSKLAGHISCVTQGRWNEV